MSTNTLAKREVLGAEHIPYLRHVDDHTIALINGEAVPDPVFTGLDECTKDTVATCIQK